MKDGTHYRLRSDRKIKTAQVSHYSVGSRPPVCRHSLHVILQIFFVPHFPFVYPSNNRSNLNLKFSDLFWIACGSNAERATVRCALNEGEARAPADSYLVFCGSHFAGTTRPDLFCFFWTRVWLSFWMFPVDGREITKPDRQLCSSPQG